MSSSIDTANKVLAKLLRGVDFAAPAGVFVSLHTADPGRTGANEIDLGAWPAYVRRDATGGGARDAGFSDPANGESTNLLQLLWPALDGAAPITLTHFGVWHQLEGGLFIVSGALQTQRILQVNDEYLAHIGDLKIIHS